MGGHPAGETWARGLSVLQKLSDSDGIGDLTRGEWRRVGIPATTLTHGNSSGLRSATHTT